MSILAGVALVLGIVGGGIGLENHFVNRDLNTQGERLLKVEVDKDLAQLANTIQSIQREAVMKGARDELFYWQRSETELEMVRARLGKSPSREFENKLLETIDKRKAAEQRVRSLEEGRK